jgi:hypothetical protein
VCNALYVRVFSLSLGSVAGPVIFLLYLSSLFGLIKTFAVQVGGYVDDNQLYLSVKPMDEHLAIEEMSSDLHNSRQDMDVTTLSNK